jgi:hypothetical protein
MNSITIDGLCRSSEEIVSLIEKQQLQLQLQRIPHQESASNDNEPSAKLGLFAVAMDQAVGLALVRLIQDHGPWKRISMLQCSGPCAIMVITHVVMSRSEAFHLVDHQSRDHAESVGLFSQMGIQLGMSTAPLKGLGLPEWRWTRETLGAIGMGLCDNTTLEELDLRNAEITSRPLSLQPLARGLRGATSLRVLNLRACQLGGVELSLLVRALIDHPSLQELYLRGNACRSQDISTLLDESTSHCQLQTLDWSRQEATGDDIHYTLDMEPFARALRCNQTLKFLDLSDNLQLDDSDIQLLATALLHNHTLQHLLIGGRNDFGPGGAKALLEVMKTNVSIERFRLPTHRGSEMEKCQRQVTFFANLNRAGRRILSSQYNTNDIPSALWALIVERINAIKWGANGRRWGRPNMMATKNGDTERASVLFCLLRDAPVLLERYSSINRASNTALAPC